MKKSPILALLTIALALPGAANAATIWNIERLSDQQANITMSGTIDEALSDTKNLTFIDASQTNGDIGNEAAEGDFSIGGVAAELTFVGLGTTNFEIRFADLFAAGSVATGTLMATLDAAEIWGETGTSGFITNGVGGTGNVIGTYNITNSVATVPLPAGMPLLLAALGGIAGLRLRNKRTSSAKIANHPLESNVPSV